MVVQDVLDRFDNYLRNKAMPLCQNIENWKITSPSLDEDLRARKQDDTADPCNGSSEKQNSEAEKHVNWPRIQTRWKRQSGHDSEKENDEALKYENWFMIQTKIKREFGYVSEKGNDYALKNVNRSRIQGGESAAQNKFPVHLHFCWVASMHSISSSSQLRNQIPLTPSDLLCVRRTITQDSIVRP
jgi:hypothetical protein